MISLRQSDGSLHPYIDIQVVIHSLSTLWHMLVHPKAWRELGNQVGTGPRGEVGAIQTNDGTAVDKQDIADKFCKFFSSMIGLTTMVSQLAAMG